MRTLIPGILIGSTLTTILAFTFHLEEPACVIGLDKMNVLYCGVDNPVSILVRGVPEADVRIETSDNLTIQKNNALSYTVRASTPGEGSITVSGGRLQPLTFKYRVKRMPDPVLMLGSTLRSCTTGNGTFKAQGGLSAIIENTDIDARIDMISFQVVHMRKGQLLSEITNKGGRFDQTVLPVINAAEPGDTYIFTDAKVRCPGDQYARTLGQTLTFVIK